MAQVTQLEQTETDGFDSGRLTNLYRRLGQDHADYVLGHAVEDLAMRVARCERLSLGHDTGELEKSARGIVVLAEQVGMLKLASVAGNVADTAKGAQSAAAAATLSRLVRVADHSLTAIWDWHEPAG